MKTALSILSMVVFAGAASAQTVAQDRVALDSAKATLNADRAAAAADRVQLGGAVAAKDLSQIAPDRAQLASAAEKRDAERGVVRNDRIELRQARAARR